MGGWCLFTSEFVGGGEGTIVPLGHRSTKEEAGLEGYVCVGGGGGRVQVLCLYWPLPLKNAPYLLLPTITIIVTKVRGVQFASQATPMIAAHKLNKPGKLLCT